MTEFVYDDCNIVVMQSNDEKEFYAIEGESFRAARINYYDCLKSAYRTDKKCEAPEIEAKVFVEKEVGKLHIGEQSKIVSFDAMKGVMIRLN